MLRNQRKNSGKVSIILIAVILVFAVAISMGMLLITRFQGMQGLKPAAATQAPSIAAEEPAPEPTAEPMPEPAAEPTPEPTAEPTPEPTAEPTPEPTEEPIPTVSPEAIKAAEEAERAKAAARKAESSAYSFYQKLKTGYGANILVLGDASAMDKQSDGINGVVDGTKFSGLSEHLKKKYPATMGGQISVNNLAHTGGNILCDVTRVAAMPEEPSYDLVLLSYGMNDLGSDVYNEFGALIYALHSKFPDSSIMFTVEPGLNGMTKEQKTMMDECNVCGIPVIDLAAAISEKGAGAYSEYLEADRPVPNEKGTEEWIRLLCETIDVNVERATGKMHDMPSISDKSRELASMQYIPVTDPRVSRTDDTSYALDFKAEGPAYIRHKEMIGKENAKVIADGMLYSFGKPSGAETPDGRYITLIYGSLISTRNFTITFESKELADGLEGFYLLEKTEG